MSKMFTEKQVLKKLNIHDFSQLSKENVIDFVELIDQMDPEVVNKALEQFTDFAEASIQGINYLKDTIINAIEHDEESEKLFFKMCDRIIDAIEFAMSDGVVTFEEKKYCIEKMQEIAEMARDKIMADKIAIWKLIGNFALVCGIFVATTVITIGAHTTTYKSKN